LIADYENQAWNGIIIDYRQVNLRR